MIYRLPGLAVFAAVAALAVAAPSGGAADSGGGGSNGAENPCEGPESGHLLCPDLRVGTPSDLYVEHSGGAYGHGGGTLLHATSDIRSRGRGPMELRGRRYKRNWMHANQAIYKVGGGVKIFQTDAKIHFYDVGAYWGGSYWKVHDPLSMEIWSLDEHGHPLKRIRKGPKVFYCLRDLERTKPMKRSPSHRVYPGCNQDPGRERVRLGTSVGWSDIYPSEYDRQWVNVSGLRGCFAYVMRVDPQNLFYEENEHDNRSFRIVRLPYHPGAQHC